ncbi:MAG: type II secretion system F family protein [Lachnospiraceae bacterium]|nr:type II secretion system F family protein [Lachnospiraceae bacterium]
MSDMNLLMGRRISMTLTAAFLFGLIFILGRQRPERKILSACMELKGYLSAKQQKTDWYGRTSDWLRKKGADIHFGTWMQPTVWLAMRIIFAVIGFAVGNIWSFWSGGIMAFGLYELPYILVWYLNNRDNEKMIPEIQLIYHALEIQIRAGVYVADALTECYAGVQERRLRQALLDLAGAITMKADIYDAMEQFQGKFDNRYIDALCITILQTLESGQALELLGDIAEQVRDMEVAVMNRRKGALDRSITFYQLGILAAMLGMVIYACVTQMFTAALSF